MKITYLFVFIPLLLIISCQDKNSDEMVDRTAMVSELPQNNNIIQITKAQFDAAGMELGQVTTLPFPHTVLTNGYIDVPPKSKAAVSVYYGGYVQGLDLLPGQRVRKGQVLFVLENPDFVQMEQDYVEAIAKLAYLSSDYERQKTLAAEQIASQKNFLKAESDYQVQQARIEGLRKKLQLLGLDLKKIEAREFTSRVNIYSPISGFITAVNTSSGSYLNTSDVAVEITSTDHLHLELDVFEKDVQALRKGQQIQFRVPGAAGQTHKASVHLIGSIVEGENRVVRVHGHLEDEHTDNHGLIPGMYIEAEIITASDSVTALPEEALVNIEEQYFLLLQQNTSGPELSFERIPVRTGRTVNGMIELLDQPALPGPILTKGAFDLIME